MYYFEFPPSVIHFHNHKKSNAKKRKKKKHRPRSLRRCALVCLQQLIGTSLANDDID